MVPPPTMAMGLGGSTPMGTPMGGMSSGNMGMGSQGLQQTRTGGIWGDNNSNSAQNQNYKSCLSPRLQYRNYSMHIIVDAIRCHLREILYWVAGISDSHGHRGSKSSRGSKDSTSGLQISPWNVTTDDELPPGGGEVVNAVYKLEKDVEHFTKAGGVGNYQNLKFSNAKKKAFQNTTCFFFFTSEY